MERGKREAPVRKRRHGRWEFDQSSSHVHSIDGLEPHFPHVGLGWWHVFAITSWDSCCQSSLTQALSCAPVSRLLRFFFSCSIHPSRGSIRGTRLSSNRKSPTLVGAPKSGPFLPVGPGSWAFQWIMIWTCHALFSVEIMRSSLFFPTSDARASERIRVFFLLFFSSFSRLSNPANDET